MRSRRELENTFDSIAHLVVVCDRRGRIVHANQAFARAARSDARAAARPAADRVHRPRAGAPGSTRAQSADRAPAGAPTLRSRRPVLKGPFMVTVTDLLDHERRARRQGARRARPDAAVTPRGRARGAAQAADAVGEAGGARPVRRRHRPRAEQPAAGRPRPPRAAARDRRVSEAAAARGADDLPRSRPRRQDRAEPAGLRRLAAPGPRAGQPDVTSLQKVVALRQSALRAQDIEVVRHYDENCRACRAIRCCSTRCFSTS